MLINYRNELLHDSSLDLFRDPVGAVTAGTPVKLRFRARLENVNSVYLCLFRKDFREQYAMRQLEDCWEIEITAPVIPEVYWYYFTINIGGRICYYGAQGSRTAGVGCVYSEHPPSYQLTVYDPGFQVPRWFQKSVMYQIFPDRFRRSDDRTAKNGIDYHRTKGRKVHYHEKWKEKPLFGPLPGEKHYNPCDYFGGTLKGIEDSLEYLQSLGVTVVYLNPVFEAASNHRYNTADYFKIDPVLGTNEDFVSLCRKAAGMGIRVMLDGVFSHTGSDSIYFNREGHYDVIGAANSKESPYYSWYDFKHYPDQYRCWWGFASLPEVNENDPAWQQYIITGENSVIRHWLRAGARGYRLDVADELPDDILAIIYKAARETDPEAVVLGEVWEDATTKYSYGAKRQYALGRMLDSVTNYPLRNALVGFFHGRANAEDLKRMLVDQAANYPRPMYYALTNLLSSHDIERVRTALSTRIDPHQLSREQQASFVLTATQTKKGAQRHRLAATLQFSLPGVPCVYYGDERGMQGFLDPFNRQTFQEAPHDLTDDYRQLARLRQAADAMQTGHVVFFAPDPDCLGVLRYVTGGVDALGHQADNGVFFVAVNRANAARLVVFDFLSRNQLFAADHQKKLRPVFNGAVTCQLTGKNYTIIDGLLEITLEPLSAVWLKIA
ncbi:MAG TPA: glycoside hydrolase family 13 protein [Smithella sp.]|nr:glycoside hydrolase family 13 protein [Smithella sp.]HNY50742.1 glycoside hydrolase family 13 protein [Smithella sp.]HOG90329.1 glycoside hydrolase family 13 protein [Smithella sp.]